jgi:glycosyltransferase involved in cell wall biosynthesis
MTIAEVARLPRTPDVSVVLPCLNEEATVGSVIDEAFAGLHAAGVEGEVIVVDNGSTDRSAEIARERGARVIEETRRGYGSAYLAGLAAARGESIVLADADGT